MQTLRHWLSEQPFTLVMSSGFFGFFAHAGMLQALEAAGLRPVALGGTSAGALIGGWSASGVAADAIVSRLETVQRGDFWDPSLGLGLLEGARFEALLSSSFGAARFEDCPVPVRVAAWEVATGTTRVFAEGPLVPAVRASCSFPGLLQPRRIDGRRYLDGGIGDRAALSTVDPGARVLHHHLSSRSPWRTAGSEALRPPSAPNLTTLVIDGLPRLSPFRLAEAPRVLAQARETTARALGLPVEAGVVRVTAG
jgi:NTE family protein